MFALSTRSPRSDLIYPCDISGSNVILRFRCAQVGNRECWALENAGQYRTIAAAVNNTGGLSYKFSFTTMP